MRAYRQENWPEGLSVYPELIPEGAARVMLGAVRQVIQSAPLYTPVMPRSGRPMSVRMTNCGSLGWFTDKELGYRYLAHQPDSDDPWPLIPEQVMDVWRQVADYPHPPEACLVNYYDASARMGLHRDSDEQAMDAPVVSISLGDTALFRVGGPSRQGRTHSLKLVSGTVLVLGGAARYCFHGVDRIYPGTSPLLPEGGRINLTLRRVTEPLGSGA